MKASFRGCLLACLEAVCHPPAANQRGLRSHYLCRTCHLCHDIITHLPTSSILTLLLILLSLSAQEVIVIDTAAAQEATEEILRLHSIPAMASKDLTDVVAAGSTALVATPSPVAPEAAAAAAAPAAAAEDAEQEQQQQQGEQQEQQQQEQQQPQAAEVRPAA